MEGLLRADHYRLLEPDEEFAGANVTPHTLDVSGHPSQCVAVSECAVESVAGRLQRQRGMGLLSCMGVMAQARRHSLPARW